MTKSNDEYHADTDHVGKSMLNVFWKSPKQYYHTYITKKIKPDPKRVTLIGSATHDCLLERLPLSQTCLVYPKDCLKSDGSINSKPAKAFAKDNPGKYILKQDEFDRAKAAVEAAYSHHLGDLLRDERAEFEVPMYWECPSSGVKCKCKPDWNLPAAEADPFHVVYDLKTTESVDPSGFNRVAKSLRYWLQSIHYSVGMRMNYGDKPVRFVFWALETEFPHRIARYEYRDDDIAEKLPLYEAKMNELRRCMDTGDWSDPWELETNVLELGPWHQ